ncbi:MAG: hypothetical protein GY807_20505 [Gammaproteobacteria bacterium]|nr:hypothetical protein [Gammaproteobacteria bacterium]
MAPPAAMPYMDPLTHGSPAAIPGPVSTPGYSGGSQSTGIQAPERSQPATQAEMHEANPYGISDPSAGGKKGLSAQQAQALGTVAGGILGAALAGPLGGLLGGRLGKAVGNRTVGNFPAAPYAPSNSFPTAPSNPTGFNSAGYGSLSGYGQDAASQSGQFGDSWSGGGLGLY